MSEPKPCPLCKAQCETTEHCDMLTDETYGYSVLCAKNCCGQPCAHETKEEAITEWNHRPAEDRLRRMLAVAEEELERIGCAGWKKKNIPTKVELANRATKALTKIEEIRNGEQDAEEIAQNLF